MRERCRGYQLPHGSWVSAAHGNAPAVGIDCGFVEWQYSGTVYNKVCEVV